MSPVTYRKITIAALVAVCAIVVTGSAVRLTGSGLGCSDWPGCNDEKLVDVSSFNSAVEQINRLFTGVIAAAVVAAVLGAFKRRPARQDLKRLSIVIALGIPAQAIIGAINVWTHLNPFVNQQHFLVSMVLVALGAMLVRRSSEPDGGERRAAVAVEIKTHVAVITGLTALALVTGTFVTGAGPHAGDEDVKRFDVAITTVARIHAVTVMITIAAAGALLWRLRNRTRDRQRLDNALTTWMVMAVAQAGIGYTQYFSGVPALLVGIHVALATGLWLATVQLMLTTDEVITRSAAPSAGSAAIPASAAPTP